MHLAFVAAAGQANMRLVHCHSGCSLSIIQLSWLQVLDRGERLELLVDKTDHLQNEAFVFKRQSRQLKNKLWWRNVRLLALVFLMIAIGGYVVAAFACGPLLRHC